MPFGWHVECVPSHKHRAWLFGVVEAQQGIRKANNGTGTLAALALNGLRQRVIRSVGEGVPLLVIDGDSFAHRSYHALPKAVYVPIRRAKPAAQARP